jgi:Family of unknown function (DUF6308)
VEADRRLAPRQHRLDRRLALRELRIARLDGEELVLDGLGLALGFFRGDLKPDSYDSLAGRGASDRIETEDIRTINRAANARSPHEAWAPILDRPLPWLSAIEPGLDLIETGEARWRRLGAEELVRVALAETVAARRGLAVSTKLLHLKRPRLFPILDEFVAVMLGMNVTATAPERKLEIAMDLVLHLRREGRRNHEPLRSIQAALDERSIRLSLVRILDAVLWFSHPAAGVQGVERVIRVDRIAR